MRPATFIELESEEARALVKGQGAKPDMLIYGLTGDGFKGFARVEDVKFRFKSRELCRVVQIHEEDVWEDLEIPFLDYGARYSRDSDLDELLLEKMFEALFDIVKQEIGHHPEIEEYCFYEDYMSDCGDFKDRAKNTIRKLETTLLSWQIQGSIEKHKRTIQGHRNQVERDEESFTPGASNVEELGQESLRLPVSAVPDRSETHCLRCGLQRNECVCGKDTKRSKYSLDKHNYVIPELSFIKHH